MNTKNIRWTEEQKRALVRRAFALSMEPSFTGTRLDALRQAQSEVLEPSAHRNLIAEYIMRPWLNPMWSEAGTQYHNALRVPATPVMASEPPAPPTPTQFPRAILPIVSPAIEADCVSRQHLLSSLSMVELLTEFCARVEQRTSVESLRQVIRAEVNRVIEQRIPGMLLVQDSTVVEEPVAPSPEPAPAPEQRTMLPKVLILGLHSSQIEIINSTYRGGLDIRHMTGAEGASRVRHVAENMDLTICTKWVKGTLGSTSGWPHFTFISGGMDSIKRAINQKFKLIA